MRTVADMVVLCCECFRWLFWPERAERPKVWGHIRLFRWESRKLACDQPCVYPTPTPRKTPWLRSLGMTSFVWAREGHRVSFPWRNHSQGQHGDTLTRSSLARPLPRGDRRADLRDLVPIAAQHSSGPAFEAPEDLCISTLHARRPSLFYVRGRCEFSPSRMRSSWLVRLDRHIWKHGELKTAFACRRFRDPVRMKHGFGTSSLVPQRWKRLPEDW